MAEWDKAHIKKEQMQQQGKRGREQSKGSRAPVIRSASRRHQGVSSQLCRTRARSNLVEVLMEVPSATGNARRKTQDARQEGNNGGEFGFERRGSGSGLLDFYEG